MYLSRYINFPDSPGSSCLLLQYNFSLHLAPRISGALCLFYCWNICHRTIILDSMCSCRKWIWHVQGSEERKNSTFMTIFFALIFRPCVQYRYTAELQSLSLCYKFNKLQVFIRPIIKFPSLRKKYLYQLSPLISYHSGTWFPASSFQCRYCVR